jgi:hypothetical protein
MDDGDDDHYDELKPDVIAPGSAIMAPRVGSRAAYIVMDGTSMATPHAAGVVALMLEANPDLTPDEVRKMMRLTATQRGEPFDVNLTYRYNTHYGYGMLDAYNATRAALGMEIEEPPIPVDVTVTIKEPTHMAELNGTVTVSGTAWVSNGTIDTMEFRLDNGDFKDIKDFKDAEGKAEWSYKWNTKTTFDGEHNITIRATSNDSFGEGTLRVVVNNTGVPGGKPSSADDDDDELISGEQMVWIGVLGFTILVLAAMVLATRAHREKNPELYEEEREKRKKKKEAGKKKGKGKGKAGKGDSIEDEAASTAELVEKPGKKSGKGQEKKPGKGKKSGSGKKSKVERAEAVGKEKPRKRSGTGKAAAAKTATVPAVPVKSCVHCGGQLTFIPEYGRDYCYGCGQYS